MLGPTRVRWKSRDPPRYCGRQIVVVG